MANGHPRFVLKLSTEADLAIHSCQWWTDSKWQERLGFGPDDDTMACPGGLRVTQSAVVPSAVRVQYC